VKGSAAQAAASGASTIAPPSFDGHGWLFALNLGFRTAAFGVLLWLVITLATTLYRNRRRDRPRDPITVYQTIGLLISVGFCLASGAEAVSLWHWNPENPAAYTRAMTAKRLIDPVAVSFGLSGIALFFVSLPGISAQLRKRPFPINMMASLPMLRQPSWIVALSLIAATGVVLTR